MHDQASIKVEHRQLGIGRVLDKRRDTSFRYNNHSLLSDVEKAEDRLLAERMSKLIRNLQLKCVSRHDIAGAEKLYGILGREHAMLLSSSDGEVTMTTTGMPGHRIS